MQTAQLTITTTCTCPAVDQQILALIAELTDTGMTIRQATETAARRAAAAATAHGWSGELVDFVVIRTADLGARYARTA